jgi:glyoxylase-like metal-dependent hydrolase (beta-lactamase superfamily II)
MTGIRRLDLGSYVRPPVEVDGVHSRTEAALAEAGTRLDEIALVVNCHLHFDHCGGNAAVLEL